jgi:uncharacterized membrane protein YedE/YeeE
MTIDWAHFTPWMAIAGGILIGLAAAIMILLNGRVLGISGIIGGLLQPVRGDVGWRLAFVAGLTASAWLAMSAGVKPAAESPASPLWLVVAGLLVGFGTRMGSGCTSGHGVCGISRLSPRSLVATAFFMTSGFVTVYIIRHVLS